MFSIKMQKLGILLVKKKIGAKGIQQKRSNLSQIIVLKILN